MKKNFRGIFSVFILFFGLFGAGITKASVSGNISKDIPGNEITAVTEFGVIQVFSEDGSFIGNIQKENEVFEGEPYVFDINNDSTSEIIAISKSSDGINKLNILSGTGGDVFAPITLSGEVFDYYVSDIDNDKYGEIALSIQNEKLLLYKANQSGISLSNQKDIQKICFLSILSKGSENLIFCASINSEDIQLYNKDLAVNSTWKTDGLSAKGKILNDSQNYYYLGQNQILKFDGNGSHSFSNWPLNLPANAKNFYLANIDSDNEKEVIVDLINFERKIYNPDGSEVEADLLNEAYNSSMQDIGADTVMGSKNSTLYYLSKDSNILRQIGDFYHRKLNIIQSTNFGGGLNHSWTLPQYAFDNNLETFWQGHYSVDEWELTADFDKETTINNLRIYFFDYKFVPQEINAQFSLDGTTFNESYNLKLGEVTDFNKQIKARKFKLILKGKSDNFNYTPAVREIDFGDKTIFGGPSIDKNALPEFISDGSKDAFWQGSYEENEWSVTNIFSEAKYVDMLRLTYYSNLFIPQEATIDLTNDGVNFTKTLTVSKAGLVDLEVKDTIKGFRYNAKGKSDIINYTPAVREIEIISGTGIFGGPSANENLGPDKMFDSNMETYWQGGSNSDTWSVTNIFNDIRYIDILRLSYTDSTTIPQDAKIELSSDGVNWDKTITLVKGASNDYEIKQNAKALRYTATGKNSGSGKAPAITEIDLNTRNIYGGPSIYATALPELAFDSNNATFWQGEYGDNTSWYLVQDLGEAKDIEGVSAAYYNSDFIPQTFEVEGSSDGINYTSLGTMPGSDPAQLNFSSVSARFLRYKFTGRNSVTGYTPAIREITLEYTSTQTFEENPATENPGV